LSGSGVIEATKEVLTELEAEPLAPGCLLPVQFASSTFNDRATTLRSAIALAGGRWTQPVNIHNQERWRKISLSPTTPPAHPSGLDERHRLISTAESDYWNLAHSIGVW